MTLRSHHRLLPQPKPRVVHARAVRAASTRWISDEDRLKLEHLLSDPGRDSYSEWSYTRLRDVLRQARILPVAKLPGGTVRLGSTCAVHGEHLDETLRFTLTLPGDADPGRSRISVLAPIGLAVIGRREGQFCPTVIPGGDGRFQLLRVSRGAASEPSVSQRTSDEETAFERRPIPVLADSDALIYSEME